MALLLSPCDRATLEAWIHARTTPPRTVLRSGIVLLLAEGISAREVARRLGVSRHTVALWRSRLLDERRDSLTRDRLGRGRASQVRRAVWRFRGRRRQAEICRRPECLLTVVDIPRAAANREFRLATRSSPSRQDEGAGLAIPWSGQFQRAALWTRTAATLPVTRGRIERIRRETAIVRTSPVIRGATLPVLTVRVNWLILRTDRGIFPVAAECSSVRRTNSSRIVPPPDARQLPEKDKANAGSDQYDTARPGVAEPMRGCDG